MPGTNVFVMIRQQHHIGVRIRSARAERGMSQQDLAAAVGLTQQSIDAVEAGKVQRPKKLREIARALGVSEAFLLGETNDPSHTEPARILDEHADTNGYHDGWRPSLKGGIPQLDATGGLGDGSVGQVVQIDNGGIASGHLVTDEWVIPRSVLSISNLSVFAIPVDGTSMEPGLKTDDVVFVDTRPRGGIKNDEIYVIDEGSGPEVKRLSLDRDNDPPVLVIGSDNPAASTRRRPVDSVRVIGRVVGKFVKMASY